MYRRRSVVRSVRFSREFRTMLAMVSGFRVGFGIDKEKEDKRWICFLSFLFLFF